LPSPTRSKELCLITLRAGEIETPFCAVATFRSAYKIAVFEQGIGLPNISERAAQTLLNRNGKVYLWNKDEFEYEEAALWSPLGKMAIIQKIPVKK
jgi:hypothetical protein